VVTYDAARCRTEDAMMTGHMTGNAAYQGALDAPFGVGRGRNRQK
jgi:hypothetical protein